MKYDLPDWVQPDASFMVHGRRYHVRGVVDGHAVLREWWPSKRRYNYTVEHPVAFEVWETMGAIKSLKKGKSPAAASDDLRRENDELRASLKETLEIASRNEAGPFIRRALDLLKADVE